jgi:acylphosphatase
VSEAARRRLVVHGRVQGVFFRDSLRREAAGRGVAGWVRNRPDGAVEAVLEGPADAVARVEAWCGSGPPQARVERVEAASEAVEGERGFEVR